MDPIEKQERKRDAWRRLREQKQRAGRLRGRVVVSSLIAFVLLWGVVFAQMATGNDPVLGDKAAVATASAGSHRGAKAKAKALPAEEANTDAVGGGSEPATEAVETTDPEEVETQVLEAEAAEAEPEPLTTSQS